MVDGIVSETNEGSATLRRTDQHAAHTSEVGLKDEKTEHIEKAEGNVPMEDTASITASEVFAKGDYAKARELWIGVMRSVDYVLKQDGYASLPLEKKKEYQRIATNTANNLCLVSMKMGLWRDTVSYGEKALQFCPESVKTRYRMGVALYELCEFDEAEAVLNATPPESMNAAIVRLLMRIDTARKRSAAKSRNLMRKMMEGYKEDRSQSAFWPLWLTPSADISANIASIISAATMMISLVWTALTIVYFKLGLFIASVPRISLYRASMRTFGGGEREF